MIFTPFDRDFSENFFFHAKKKMGEEGSLFCRKRPEKRKNKDFFFLFLLEQEEKDVIEI